jgi:hypothetical protein
MGSLTVKSLFKRDFVPSLSQLVALFLFLFLWCSSIISFPESAGRLVSQEALARSIVIDGCLRTRGRSRRLRTIKTCNDLSFFCTASYKPNNKEGKASTMLLLFCTLLTVLSTPFFCNYLSAGNEHKLKTTSHSE